MKKKLILIMFCLIFCQLTACTRYNEDGVEIDKNGNLVFETPEEMVSLIRKYNFIPFEGRIKYKSKTKLDFEVSGENKNEELNFDYNISYCIPENDVKTIKNSKYFIKLNKNFSREGNFSSTDNNRIKETKYITKEGTYKEINNVLLKDSDVSINQARNNLCSKYNMFCDLIANEGKLSVNKKKIGEKEYYIINTYLKGSEFYEYFKDFISKDEFYIFKDQKDQKDILSYATIEIDFIIDASTLYITEINGNVSFDKLKDLLSLVSGTNEISNAGIESTFKLKFSNEEISDELPKIPIKDVKQKSEKTENIKINKEDYLVDISKLKDADYDSESFTSWYKKYKTAKSKNKNTDYYNGEIDVDKIDEVSYNKRDTYFSEDNKDLKDYEEIGSFISNDIKWVVYQVHLKENNKIMYFCNNGTYSISVDNTYDNKDATLEEAEEIFNKFFK